MRIRLILFFIFLFIKTITAVENDASEYIEVPLNISVVPGLSIGDMMSESTGKKVMNTGITFNLLAGSAARLRGVEFSYIMGRYTEDITGVQFSGILNFVQRNARALQFSGIMNHVGGQFEGAQFGGIINSAGKDALCAQFSGILNRAHGPFIGAQFGGVGNYVHQDVQGIQTSGVVNLTMGTLNGIQIAGVVNIARKVQKGIQIGVVNVSEENEGVPIGLVSYVKNVPMHFETWGDEMGFFHMGWRSGNRRVYNIVSISSKLQGDTFWWGFGSGLGVRYSMSKKWQFDCGFMSMQVRRFARCGSETDEVNTLKMVAIYRIANRFSIFGGPTLNVLCTRNERTSTLVPWSFHEGRWKERRIHMWPGFVFGVRI